MIVPGTTYRFAIRARNIYGYAESISPIVSVLAIDVPDQPAPPIVTLGSGADNTKVQFTWTNPTLTHGSAVEEVQVQFRTSSGTFVSDSGCNPIPLS